MTMVVHCDVCTLPVPHSVCFLLKPCSHIACVKCFHQAIPVSYALRCPCAGCHQWVTSSVLMELADAPTMLNNKTCTDNGTAHTEPSRKATIDRTDHDKVTEIQEVSHFEPDEQMDPFRHWAMKKPQLYTGFIYVAYRMNDEEATFYKTNFKALNSTVFMDDASSDELVKIFARILHPLMFRRDFGDVNAKQHKSRPGDSTSVATTGYGYDKENIGTTYVIPPAKTQREQYLAMRCLYALSSGRVLTRQQQKEIEQFRQIDLERKAHACARFLTRELDCPYKKSSPVRKSLMEKFQKSSSSIAVHCSIDAFGCKDDIATADSDEAFQTCVLVVLLLSAVFMIGDGS